MEKLRGTESESSEIKGNFLNRLFRSWFGHTLKPKIDKPDKNEEDTSTSESEPSFTKITEPHPTDRQTPYANEKSEELIKSQQPKKMSPKERSTLRRERRKKRYEEKRKAKENQPIQQVDSNGFRILDKVDLFQEITGETNVGSITQEDETRAMREKGDAEPMSTESQEQINIKLKHLDQEDILSINLHGSYKDSVKSQLDTLIENGKANRTKFVLVITGKGNKSKNGKPILRPEVKLQLISHKKRGSIKSFQFAPRHLGGKGAFIVILK